jgi:hypothetical protein
MLKGLVWQWFRHNVEENLAQFQKEKVGKY